MPRAPTLLVVEGHPGVRHWLVAWLARAPGIGTVQTAGTLDEALTLAHAHTPDLAICEPKTVGGESAAVVRRLRHEVAHVRTALLGAGATAVLLKGDSAGLLREIAARAADGQCGSGGARERVQGHGPGPGGVGGGVPGAPAPDDHGAPGGGAAAQLGAHA